VAPPRAYAPKYPEQFRRGGGGSAAGRASHAARGDERLTPLIAQRYAQRRELMEIHQREVASSERRRRQAIELLFKIQDRRNREAIPDAEVLEALGDRGQGHNA